MGTIKTTSAKMATLKACPNFNFKSKNKAPTTKQQATKKNFEHDRIGIMAYPTQAYLFWPSIISSILSELNCSA